MVHGNKIFCGVELDGERFRALGSDPEIPIAIAMPLAFPRALYCACRSPATLYADGHRGEVDCWRLIFAREARHALLVRALREFLHLRSCVNVVGHVEDSFTHLTQVHTVPAGDNEAHRKAGGRRERLAIHFCGEECAGVDELVAG